MQRRSPLWRLQFMNLVLLSAAGTAQTGCGWLFGDAFVAGTSFSGDVPCTMDIIAPDGMTASDDFTQGLVITVDTDGRLLLNGAVIAVGTDVVRSIPTADLSFEVVSLEMGRQTATVTYEPRPSLPGITVEGTLVERYRLEPPSILVSAEADLTINDVEGDTQLDVSCAGSLPQSAP